MSGFSRQNVGISRAIALSAAALGSSCSPNPDHTRFHDAIRSELRDPASAEFRNERIRTLWTSDGQRRTIYCAEVNANNGLGGRTGFLPVTIEISSRGLPPHLAEMRRPGRVWLDRGMNSGFYYDCIRPDTQREGPLGRAIPDIVQFNQTQFDASFPVISNDVAPEER